MNRISREGTPDNIDRVDVSLSNSKGVFREGSLEEIATLDGRDIFIRVGSLARQGLIAADGRQLLRVTIPDSYQHSPERFRERSYEAGALTINPSTYQVTVDGEEIEDLKRLEFCLLDYVSSHPGVIFRRNELLREVWDYSEDRIAQVTGSTVTEHWNRLKLKMGEAGERDGFLRTVRKVGYKFVGQLDEPESETE